MNNNPTPAEAARLKAAERRFFAKTQGLSPRVLRMRLTSMAGSATGTGDNAVDPLEASLARQTLAALDIEERVEAGKKELEELKRTINSAEFRPGDPDHKVRALARREELETSLKLDMARAIDLSQDNHRKGREEALAAYRAEEKRAERHAAIVAAAEAKVAAQAVDPGTVDALAATLANRR